MDLPDSAVELVRKLRDIVLHSINRFDADLVRAGLTSLLETLLLNACIALGCDSVSAAVFVLFQSGLLFLRAAMYSGEKSVLMMSNLAFYASIAYRTVTLVLFAHRRRRSLNLAWVLVGILGLSSGLSAFSNSFVVFGGSITRFFTSSMSLLLAYNTARTMA